MTTAAQSVFMDRIAFQSGRATAGLAIGDVVEWPLTFFEGVAEAVSTVVSAIAEPDPGPVEDEIGATGEGVDFWGTRLVGDGWSAGWAPTQPVVGPVELTGML